MREVTLPIEAQSAARDFESFFRAEYRSLCQALVLLVGEVVSNWRPTTFAQADPAVAEAQATERLEEFLAARIAGRGAEGYVDVYAQWLGQQVPLLYATTSGSPYERSESSG